MAFIFTDTVEIMQTNEGVPIIVSKTGNKQPCCQRLFQSFEKSESRMLQI